MATFKEYRNDAEHPTLSRALPLAQATLDAGAPQGCAHPGRDAYGDCAVLESLGGQGLTDFTFGGTTTGEAWSINPYSGCAHACTYCYVPDTIKAERGRWGSYAVVKRDVPTQLSRFVRTKKRMTVYLSTATDPYQPLEAEHEVTRRCLEILVRKDWPVEILTRSPLVLRDLDLLSQLSQVRVGFSIPMLDDRVRRALEPRAPAIPARLRALRKVSDAGIATFANYTPACPPTTHDADAVAHTFLEAGAQWVNSKGLQRQETTLVPMWERLHGTEFEDLTRFLASRERQEAWHQQLGKAFQKVGLAFSTPFFNPTFDTAPLPRPGRQADLSELPRLPVLVPAVRGRRRA